MYRQLDGVCFDSNAVLKLNPVDHHCQMLGVVEPAPALFGTRHSLNTMVNAVCRDRPPRVLLVRKRPVAKVDSTGFMVRSCSPCASDQTGLMPIRNPWFREVYSIVYPYNGYYQIGN